MRIFLLSLPLLKGHPKFNKHKLTLFWKSRWQIKVQRQFTVTSGQNIQTHVYRDCLEVTDGEHIQVKQIPIKQPTSNTPRTTA